MLYILEAQFLLTVLLCENFHLIDAWRKHMYWGRI